MGCYEFEIRLTWVVNLSHIGEFCGANSSFINGCSTEHKKLSYICAMPFQVQVSTSITIGCEHPLFRARPPYFQLQMMPTLCRIQCCRR
jgi:hypothetical protein